VARFRHTSIRRLAQRFPWPTADPKGLRHPKGRRSEEPFGKLRAVSPSASLRAVSLSNGEVEPRDLRYVL
jgi:hypothetical protein